MAFEALPLKEKTLIWHLYQAALAGRDIFVDQKYAPSLEMRDVLEAILTNPAGVDPPTLDGDQALHEAVLDQQRAPQQPHRAKVRAATDAGSVLGRGARSRKGAARSSR